MLLADQDRSRWNRALIGEGLALVERALSSRRFGPYSLQGADYQFAHSARAELLRRLGRKDDASDAYERALPLAHQEIERRFLERRIGELSVT